MNNVTSTFPFQTTWALARRHPFIHLATNICLATAIAGIAGAATYWSLASNSVDPVARIAQIQQGLDEPKARVLVAFYNALPFEKPPLRGDSLIEQAAWAKFWLEGEGRPAGNPVVRNCTDLELSFESLTELPPEIKEFKALRFLGLYHNQLVRLPSEIGQLTALTRLDLTHNQLTALPPEIGQLTALTRLDLTRNQLTALPPQIGQLTALTYLDLTRNQLTALPPQIGQLTALTRLDLWQNQLTALPDSILNLSQNCQIFARLNNLSPNVVADFQQRLANHRANHPNEGPVLHADVPDVQNIGPRAPEVPLDTKLQAWATEFELTFPGQGHRTQDFSPLTSLNPDETAKLGAFLDKIRKISDYAQPIKDSTKDVIARVENMIQLACLHPDFRAKMLLSMAEGNTNCHDRTLHYFNELEVEAHFYEVEQRDNTFICQTIQDNSFVAKAIQTASYYVLQEYAKKYATGNNLQDTIETVLGFHTFLRPLLAETKNPLPISTESMLYSGVSGVTPGAIEEGKKFMLAHAAPTFLLEHSPQWQQRMRDRYPEKANVVYEKFTALQEAATEFYFDGLDEEAKRALLEANPTLQSIVQQHATHKDPKQAYDLATLDIQELIGVSLAYLGGDFVHIMSTQGPGPGYDRLKSIFNPDEMRSLFTNQHNSEEQFS